ncbi:MAG: serine hydrolase domain-containing protein [Gemmatimonadota bacterium]
MRLSRLPLVCIPLIPFFQLHSQTAAPERPRALSDAITEARRFIRDTMKVLGAPGASITVIRNGRVIWSEGFGYADVENQVRVTPQTRFRVGSVSKPLTSIALGLLYEEGKIDLDAPVQRYVPGFPAKRWPITVRQVAGHLAGIRHYNDGEFDNMRYYPTVDSGLSIFKNDSLLFEPGTRYSYSSYGWNLLSAVIEGASGQPFLTFMKTRVFAAAGLTHTGPEYTDSIIPFRARFYTRTDSVSPVINAQYVDNSYKWAGGGFLSTTDDLAHFGELLLEGRLLKPETRNLWWTSQKTSNGRDTGYGIGWGTSTDSTGRRRIGHTGGAMGGTASLQIFPKEKLVIALLVNSDYTFLSAVPRLAALFMN